MNFRAKRWRLLKIGAITIAVLAVVEIAVRLTGVTDFAVYAVDSGIGYIPKPNQAGRFLDKNEWVFNDKSMPTANRWTPAKLPNILLIGNSVVMGGKPYDQKDKLGPLVANDVGSQYAVWPIATGGWTTINEIVYLDRHPDVVRSANFFVWEYRAGGLSALSEWRGNYVFPSKWPIWATWYALRRYVLPRILPLNTNELPPTGAVDEAHLRDFRNSIAELSKAAAMKHPGFIFIYPDKRQFLMAKRGEEWLPERAALEEISKRNNLKIVDVAQNSNWTAALYRDSTHPTVQGNEVLAHTSHARDNRYVDVRRSNGEQPCRCRHSRSRA